MAITFYDLKGAEGRRFSPYCWRARMALAHKGLEAGARVELVGFTEKHKIAFTGQPLVPVIVDGDKAVWDSWAIACHLDDAYPDRPMLLGSAALRGLSHFVSAFGDRVMMPQIASMIVFDIFRLVDPVDRPYFRETREKRFGMPLERVQDGREERRERFRESLAPLRIALGARAFLGGEAPCYGDYALFGPLQWARLTSPFELLAADDPVAAWRERMLDTCGGIARTAA